MCSGPAVQTPGLSAPRTQTTEDPEHCRSVLVTACLLYLLSLPHTEALSLGRTSTQTCPKPRLGGGISTVMAFFFLNYVGVGKS